MLTTALPAAEGGSRPIPPGAERTVLLHLRLIDGAVQVVSAQEFPEVADRPRRVGHSQVQVEALDDAGAVVASAAADFRFASEACLHDPQSGTMARHVHGQPEAFVRLVDRGQSRRLRVSGTAAAAAAGHGPGNRPAVAIDRQEIPWAR
jgi:hypothetical protein